MPRNSNGDFTLVAGNPVVSGTTISASWANSTLPDIATGLTESLDRNGRGGMLAPFRFSDGTVGAPGATWSSEPTTGFYRASGGDLRVSVLGNDIFRWNNGEASVWDAGAVQWRTVLVSTVAGMTGVPPGTVSGQSLRWNGTGWETAQSINLPDASTLRATANLEVIGKTTLGNEFDGNAVVMKNVGAPVDADDATTKTYVDNAITTAPFVPTARTVTGVGGLIGGGDLTIDRQIALDLTSDSNLDHSLINMTAGAGLTGGGDIAETRTFNVVGGDGITANPNDIQVDDTVTRTAFAGGLNFVIDSGSPSGSDPNTIYFVT